MSRLSVENEKRAKKTISLYPRSRSALIPLLHLAQEQNGWLTPDSIKHVAELLEITPAEVLSVASFYDMFHTEPVGKNLIGICTNLACMLEGGYELLEYAEEKLGVKPGGTTPDDEFSLEEVECMAACDKAPVCVVNWRYFHNVSKSDFDKLIGDVKSKRLNSDIPNHGIVTRVQRDFGLVTKDEEGASQ
jgi:NADH-quinone oxidoreductase subunit E